MKRWMALIYVADLKDDRGIPYESISDYTFWYDRVDKLYLCTSNTNFSISIVKGTLSPQEKINEESAKP